MRIAVTIIAHNEEEYIARCIDSILCQTRKPDEIVLVCHNCTDQTENIAKKYQGLNIISYDGPEGEVYARMKAIKSVSPETDIVASTDGDSYADKKWLENLVRPLEEDRGISGTGGLVLFSNSVYAFLMSTSFFFISPVTRKKYKFYFWGSNNAFRLEDYRKVGGHSGLPGLKKQLALRYWAEDLYIALLLDRLGSLKFTPAAVIWSHAPRLGVRGWLERSSYQRSDKNKLFKHFGLPV